MCDRFRVVGSVTIGLFVLCGAVRADEDFPAAIEPANGPAVVLQQSLRPTQRRAVERRERGGSWWSRWWRGTSDSQKNHASVKAAYRAAAKTAGKSTARIMADGDSIALATVVDAKGYLVTKASLLRDDKKLTAIFADREPVDVALVGVDEDYDVALLKVDGIQLTPIAWRAADVDSGTFVAAVDQVGGVIGVGVVSTEPRAIRGTRQANPRRAWLGVSLGGGDTGTGITDVLKGSAARRAGLSSGDIIRRIDGNVMKSMEQVITTIGKHRPGDKVVIQVRRGDETLDLTATLGRPPQSAFPQDQWGGGPFSARREGFPKVITHDTFIRPNECGGPLIDTDGKAVGITIARALRVTSYAVPADVVQRLVKELKKS